jgi:hypothetical protein
MTNYELEKVILQLSEADNTIEQLQPSSSIDFRLKQTAKSILALIENLWQNTIAALIAAPTTEPELKIWQTQDRHGRIHWRIKDPLTSESVSFASELEMLRWLENLTSRSRW